MIKRMFRKLRNIKNWKNILLFGAGIFVLFMSMGVIWISSFKIPNFTSFEDQKVVNSTKIYDRTGKVLLYDIHDSVQRTNIPFEDMGANIKNATVAIEDAEFYSHKGIRITSIIRAVISTGLYDLFHIGRPTGGSTITQQLVKNTLLNSQRSIGRKIKEWVLAIKVDQALSKEKILELYLNEVPYGGTIYGIKEASNTYFGIEPANLDLAQAAYLASIPQSPSVLSPYGRNKDKLESRKNLVLSRMKELGFISDTDYQKAKNEVVTFLPQSLGGIKAPHFVFFIKDYLDQKYGADAVRNGGLKVTTTLDYNLEQKAENIVKTSALNNEKQWNASNAALVAIDPKTGQILSMVGSRNYFDKAIEGNFNVALANRQPGSSFKPFIYATAFNEGFTPNTVLFDVPTEFQTTCDAYGKALPGHSQSDCYMPQDFDGKTRGPMSLRDALAQSINIPAVKLFYLVGLKDGLQTAESMGISTLADPSRYGLTLVIGGGEVNLLDLTSAYSVFANDGTREPYTGILKVENSRGDVLEQFTPNEKSVLPKNTALTISDILSDNTARTPTFGANSALNIPGRDVAVKTGTTNNDKDAWTVGYTPSITVGVWVGNNNNKAMKNGGAALAGPIWNKFITAALQDLPNEQFEAPDLSATTDPSVKPILRGFWQGNETFLVDSLSGGLATPNTPIETTQEKSITNVHTILYWVDKNNITGPPPANPSNDSQFSHWEIPVQNWWNQNKWKYGVVTANDKPTSSDTIHNGTSNGTITIVSPNSSATYPAANPIGVQIISTGSFPLTKADLFINDVYLTTMQPPFSYTFTPSQLDNLRPINTIKIVGYDSVFNHIETSSTFKVAQ
jgi:penicillin-binding protein 1C